MKPNIFGQNTVMAAKQNSKRARTKKYLERDSRRGIRQGIKKLRAEMEEIRAEVDLISRRQKHFKGKSLFQGDKQLRKEEKTLQRMEAKAAQARAGTSRMRKETTAMVEAMDDKKAELELLRVLHIHLFNEMVLLSETEEGGIEILLS